MIHDDSPAFGVIAIISIQLVLEDYAVLLTASRPQSAAPLFAAALFHWL